MIVYTDRLYHIITGEKVGKSRLKESSRRSQTLVGKGRLNSLSLNHAPSIQYLFSDHSATSLAAENTDISYYGINQKFIEIGATN